MKHTTIEDIEKLREIIAIREDRIGAITRRATAIANSAKTMSLAELEAAAEEVTDLRKEIAEHKEIIRKAKLIIAKYYAPASVA